ncbi:hypothetical protein BH09SUM1_BH09SUM1_05580 [soil metagenome]
MSGGAMKIECKINGEARTLDVHPMTSLLDALRVSAGLTGTKYGCGEGECGACTVLLDGDSVMSCMVPSCQAAGREIKTIEGMAEGAVLHPIQQAFLDCGGAQCGICTPGMIMSAHYYEEHRERIPGGIPEALEGNLCRCTGYMRIFEAVERAIK